MIFVAGDFHLTGVYDKDGRYEARPCPVGIPVPNDVTIDGASMMMFDIAGSSNVTIESGNPRALLAALRDAAGGSDVQGILARRAERQSQAADELGPLASMMLAEIENGASASASDRDWLTRFGVSRQRAQQVLAELARGGFHR